MAPPRIARRCWLGPWLLVLACGSEPPTVAVPTPDPEDKPPVPPSRLKFDVGAMPQPSASADPATVSALRERLADPEAAALPLRSSQTVAAFYAQREFSPAWTLGKRITAQGVDALRALARLRDHGLDPQHYGLDALTPDGAEPRDAVAFELQLTDAWLTAAVDLAKGRVDPESLASTGSADGRADDLVAVLQASLDEGKAGETLLAQAPPHPEYQALVNARRALRLRKKLPSEQTTELLEQLPTDLERWRWLPRELGPRHVRIDLGAGQLVMHDGEKREPTMRVATSKRCAKLRSYGGTITHVVLGPDTPASGPLTFRLADDTVELHGAGEGKAFPEDGALRSGCIRLEDPSALAQSLLRGQPEGTAEAIDAALGAGKAQEIALTAPVPVLLTTFSVVLDQQGRPKLREGAHRRDAALRAALAKAPRPAR